MKHIPKSVQLAGFLIGASLFIACKKHQDDPAPGSKTTTYSSASDFVQKNQVKSQYYTLNASAGGTVKGEKGTELTFPANAFKDEAGNVVTGNVKIEIKEVLKPKDMLFSGVLPVSDGKPLVSGGELYIRVTQESSLRIAEDSIAVDSTANDSIVDPFANNELQLGDSVFIGIRVPVDTIITSMQLFQGSIYNSDVNWVIMQNQGRWTNSVNGFTSPYQGYFFTCHALHWINVDSFMEGVLDQNIQWTSVTCALPNGFTESSSNLYVYYNGLNSIFPINVGFSNTLTSYEIVQGMDITIIGISTDANGQLYSVFYPMKATSPSTINLDFSPCTGDEFKSKMDALN